MSFTPSQIITRAKYRLGISTSDTSPDTKMLQWINDCHDLLNSELVQFKRGWLPTAGTQNIVQNQDEYSIPTEAILVSNVYYLKGDTYLSLVERPEFAYDSYDKNSPNTYDGDSGYFVVGDKKIRIRGITNENTTNGLKIEYFPNTTDYTSSSSIAEMNSYRLLYALYVCKTFRTAEDDKMISMFHNEFNEEFKRWYRLMKHKFSGVKRIQIMDGF